MRYLALMLALPLAGCTHTRESRYDEFEKVKVDKMIGNAVRLQVLGRTVVCLNAMRESRWPAPITNETVAFVTNYVSSSVTNITVTSSTNQQLSSNTNVTALHALSVGSGESRSAETNLPAVVYAPPQDSSGGGVTISSARNESVATAPNQAVTSRTTQTITTLNQQATVNTNNLAIVGGTNLVITMETNLLITTLTNAVITTVTNTVVASPAQPLLEYFLYTEIAPPDFSPQPGESLVVLIDGARHGLAPAQPHSGWTSRRGFVTTFYRVPPEVISGIANAQEVKVRIKGASGALERTLSRGSRQHFHDFLVRQFGRLEPELKESTVNDS